MKNEVKKKIPLVKVFKPIIALILLILSHESLYSQSQYMLDTTNVAIRSMVYYSDTFGMIFWKCDSLQPQTLFNNKTACGLQNEDSMHLVNTWFDSVGNKSTNIYHQYYKGIRVEYADYTEIYDNYGVYLTTGWIAEALNLSNIPNLNEGQALDVILNYIGAEKYIWEDSAIITNSDSCILDTAYDPSDTVCHIRNYYPVGELVYYNKYNDKNPNNYVLAWKFNSVYAIDPYSDNKWYINANTGQIIDRFSNVAENTANHWYYGTVTIDTKWYGGLRGKFTTEANDNGRNIATKYFPTSALQYVGEESPWSYKNLPHNSSSSWGNNCRDETSTLFVATQAWDLFAQSFGHHGFSNNYKLDFLRIGIIYGSNTGARLGLSDTYKDEKYEHIVFGKLDGQLTCTYDHAGHEYTHLVNHHSKKLVFGDATEASSINEGFCDIFGFLTERFSNPTGWDWTIGGDLQTSRVRSLSSPSTTPYRSVVAPGNTSFPEYYPEIYQDANWYFGPDDSHINSSLLSRCFYLLSVGGSQNSVTVSGIGIDKASQIAWFTFRNLVHSNETYAQLREHMIAAAITLYGNCSSEVFETCLAWKACGIGDICPCSGGSHGVYLWNDQCRYIPPPLPNNGLSNKNQYRIESKNIKVYPNPTSGKVKISFSEIPVAYRNNAKIIITSIDGKEQFESTYDISQTDNIEINISDLSSGLYQISIITDNDIYLYKIMKQ